MVFSTLCQTKLYSMKYLMLPLILLSALVFLPSFQAAEWDLIGMKDVRYESEQDQLKISATEGPYTHLKIFVEDAPVHFYSMRIMYHNGTFQNETFYKIIAENGSTKDIVLTGKRIDKIEFTYATPLRSQPEKARVLVFGKK